MAARLRTGPGDPADTGRETPLTCSGTQPIRQEAPLTVAATGLTGSVVSPGRHGPPTQASADGRGRGTGPGAVRRRTQASPGHRQAGTDGQAGCIRRCAAARPIGSPRTATAARAIQPDATRVTAGRRPTVRASPGQEIAGGTPRQDQAREDRPGTDPMPRDPAPWGPAPRARHAVGSRSQGSCAVGSRSPSSCAPRSRAVGRCPPRSGAPRSRAVRARGSEALGRGALGHGAQGHPGGRRTLWRRAGAGARVAGRRRALHLTGP